MQIAAGLSLVQFPCSIDWRALAHPIRSAAHTGGIEEKRLGGVEGMEQTYLLGCSSLSLARQRNKAMSLHRLILLCLDPLPSLPFPRTLFGGFHLPLATLV